MFGRKASRSLSRSLTSEQGTRANKKKSYIGLAAIAVLVLISVPVGSSINITEVMYDLPGTDKGLEWVEVYNAANISVNLTGWRLYEQESKHRLKLVQGNMTIQANGYAVIVDKPTIWLEAHPEYKGTVIDSAFSLKNTGEYIAIMNDTHDIVCNVSYTPELGANGNGFTLVLNATSNQLYEGSVEGGTPGEAAATTEDTSLNSEEEIKPVDNAEVTPLDESEEVPREEVPDEDSEE
jgi:hypothetical protein